MTLDFCLFTLPSIPFLFYHSYEENALILLTIFILIQNSLKKTKSYVMIYNMLKKANK